MVRAATPFFRGSRLHTFETLSDGRTAELVWSVQLFHIEDDQSVGIVGDYYEADGVELDDVLVGHVSLAESEGLAEGAVCPLLPAGYRDRANEATADDRTDIPEAINRYGRDSEADDFDPSEWHYYEEEAAQ